MMKEIGALNLSSSDQDFEVVTVFAKQLASKYNFRGPEEETLKTNVPCHSTRDTFNNPTCILLERIAKVKISASLPMASISRHNWNILDWDVYPHLTWSPLFWSFLCLPVISFISDPCLRNGVATYSAGDCRSYYVCNNGQPQPKCCPFGMRHEPGIGKCVVDTSCLSWCEESGDVYFEKAFRMLNTYIHISNYFQFLFS